MFPAPTQERPRESFLNDVSDVVNQKKEIDDMMSDRWCLYSVIGQAPTNGSRVSLEAYALSDGDVAYEGADEATVIKSWV